MTDSCYIALVMGKKVISVIIKNRFRQCQRDQVFLEKTLIVAISNPKAENVIQSDNTHTHTPH